MSDPVASSGTESDPVYLAEMLLRTQVSPQAVEIAKTLLYRSVAIQRAVGAMVTSARLRAFAHSELCRLLEDLPRGLPSSIPRNLTESQRQEIGEFFSRLVQTQQTIDEEPAETVTACSNFTLPWICETIRARAAEQSDMRKNRMAGSMSVATSKKKVDCRVWFDVLPAGEKRRSLCDSQPLVVVADKNLKPVFLPWAMQRFQAENPTKRPLFIACQGVDPPPGYGAVAAVETWKGLAGTETKLKLAFDPLLQLIGTEAFQVPDLLFVGDLLECASPKGNVTTAVRADRALRDLQKIASVWSANIFAFLFLPEHYDERSWRELQWSQLQANNRIVFAEGDDSGITIGRYSPRFSTEK